MEQSLRTLPLVREAVRAQQQIAQAANGPLILKIGQLSVASQEADMLRTQNKDLEAVWVSRT